MNMLHCYSSSWKREVSKSEKVNRDLELNPFRISLKIRARVFLRNDYSEPE